MVEGVSVGNQLVQRHLRIHYEPRYFDQVRLSKGLRLVNRAHLENHVPVEVDGRMAAHAQVAATPHSGTPMCLHPQSYPITLTQSAAIKRGFSELLGIPNC